MMKIQILGIGWIYGSTYGKGIPSDPSIFSSSNLVPISLPRKALFDFDDKRFGRLDLYSKTGLTAAALAFQEAGYLPTQEKRAIGIIIFSYLGCLLTDIEYYQEAKLQNGILASPNLFAYTLPSAVLGEIALRYGCCGPTWIASPSNEFYWDELLDESVSIFDSQQADAMLIGFNEPPHQYSRQDDYPAGACLLLIQPSYGQAKSLYGELEYYQGRWCNSLSHEPIPHTFPDFFQFLQRIITHPSRTS